MRVRENISNRIWIFLLIAGTAALGGCLSDEKVEEGVATLAPDTNSAPTISGSPAGAIRMGETYSFTPSASDPDGDDLTFSVGNKPVWTFFDTATGSLTGTPTLGDIGTFTNVTISVSDGQATSSMNAFSITVTQDALGSATLSWTPPTQNDDGSALTDLSGYKIYYGTVQGNYPSSVQIDNPGIATYVVENLIPDTYYFVSTAFNSIGVESTYSNEAVKVVN